MAFKQIFRKEEKATDGEITSFQSLTTALSATVGTGNIAGVATAIYIGGPGAVFWMWVSALFGMATKYIIHQVSLDNGIARELLKFFRKRITCKCLKKIV